MSDRPEAVPAEDGLRELRALSEAATPGPWGAYISYSGESGTPDEAGLFVNDKAHDVDGEKQTIISDFSLYASEHLPDLEFIVAAVNYVRAALASTERAATPARSEGLRWDALRDKAEAGVCPVCDAHFRTDGHSFDCPLRAALASTERSATPSSEEDEDERKASEFREIEDDAPTYADGCTVPLDRDGIAIFPIPEHVHEPPLATPDNAGRSPIDVDVLAAALHDTANEWHGTLAPGHDFASCEFEAFRERARTRARAILARLSESTGSEEGR